jgi:hypothetical protein
VNVVTDTTMRDDRSRPVPLLLLPKRLLVVRIERRGTTGVVSEATEATVVIVVTEAGKPRALFIERLFRRAHVMWSHRDNRGGSEAQNPGMNLHVSGLAHQVTADDLHKHFSEVGKVSRRWDRTEITSRLYPIGLSFPGRQVFCHV